MFCSYQPQVTIVILPFCPHMYCKRFSSLLCRAFFVRWSRYNPYYLEPEVRKEAYNRPETELSDEDKNQLQLKTLRPIKSAPIGVTSSSFSDPVLR